MELELKQLNDQKIRNTGGKNIKMRMSDQAQAMVFNMFTETIYKNPIGSVVREITSNCFDSHVEAGKESPENPVIIKKTYDKAAKTHYISFFDNGMGMSPERVENIYGVYFESTKRSNNNEIGGFGIGGKTPLAYTRITTDEEGNRVEDSSFFVITRYNGIEYQYCIFKGSESPEINLLTENTTDKCNGSEIRIPVLESDLSRFEREIKRQLYYFENIVFQGFEDDESLNNYNVYKGTHFLYRGGDYEDSVHVCLGKVAYKLDYGDLGLSEYDFRIPIGLKFNIGDINVAANREALQYTDDTIKTIKEKIELAKTEIKGMISKQYDNVRTIADYYAAKENFGHLHFPDNNNLNVNRWISHKSIDYANFMFNELPYIPSSDEVLKFFYNVHEYGKNRGWARDIKATDALSDVYYCNGEFKRKIIKQAYLNHIHDKNFIIAKPYGEDAFKDGKYEKMRLAFGVAKEEDNSTSFITQMIDIVPAKKAEKLLRKFAKELHKMVVANFDDYDQLEVPEDFIEDRKQERLSQEILKTTIPVKTSGYYGRGDRVTIESLINFRGKIYYGNTDDANKVGRGRRYFEAMFNSDHIGTAYDLRYSKRAKGILFVTVSKANEKYLKMCPNALHIDLIYPTMLRRKMINPANIATANAYINRYEKLDDTIYTNEHFEVINKVVCDYHKEVKEEIDSLQKYQKYSNIDFDDYLITKWTSTDKKGDLIIKTDRKLNYIFEVIEKNKEIMKWIDMPYYVYREDLNNDRYSGLVELLKKVMVF